MAKQQVSNSKQSNGANLGFEAKLWAAADKMRNNMDAAEYKHVVLGLIFLKYISDAFAEVYLELKNDPEKLSNPEDKDEYKAKNIFWVPPQARWDKLQKNAKQPTVGVFIDDAMDAIERDNASLKGVLPKNYAREGLDKQRLGELIDLVGTIGLGDKESRSKDILGRVYEYFLGQFADAEGKKGGQFYTPRSIVQLLVAMIEPFKGRVFDPCCGSGGMFVQSEKFVQAHQGRLDDIHIFGQESNQTTWRLCKMNLAIRGIESKEVNWNNEGSFLNDTHKDLKADFLLANPPFNDSDWKGEMLRDDIRWKYGVPPTGNANFAWVQHFIHHLGPKGVEGFVLANGSMSSNASGEGTIRKNIVEADLVDCMIALPSQLFYNTMISACLWFIARDKRNNKFRDRRGETLFIDARKLGIMVDRRHRELTEEDIKKVSDTYHAWRGELIGEQKVEYKDILGFCKAEKLDEIGKQTHILTPGRYVGAEEVEEDGEEFEQRIQDLSSELTAQMEEAKTLDEQIKKNLRSLGYTVSGETGLKQSDIGRIPEDWGTISFVKAISNVVDNRGKTAPTSKSGIALIATNCIKENALYPVKEKIRYVSKETYENWFRDHPKPDDIIIVNKGTPGLVCLVPNPVDFVIAQDMVAVRPDKNKIYGRFLFAFMRSKVFKHEVDSLNVGTTIPHLKKTYFPLLIVPLPSKYEQIVIGDFYYDLSKKIELNLKMNETLEAIGEAVFKRWFVDFEFPIEGGKSYKSSGGEMIYNEEISKEIPKGWIVKPIDAIADFLNGLALQKFPARGGEEYLPVIKIRELRQGITESSDKANLDIPTKYVVNNGDILFSWSGSLEVVIWGSGKGALNQHLFKVTSSRYPKWFFYYWILHYLPEYRHIAAGKATTMGHIQRHHLTDSQVIVPDDKTLERMDRLLTPILEKLSLIKVETRVLLEIRNLLLPKLMSGKIRVPIDDKMERQ